MADGTQISDGRLVMVKHLTLPADASELELAIRLSSEKYSMENVNYCVPIYDILRLPQSDSHVFIVMPLLQSWSTLKFQLLGEVIGFCQQAFTVSIRLRYHSIS